MKSKMIMILVQVLVLAAGIGATWWFTSGSKQPVAEAGAEEAVIEAAGLATPHYFSLDPAFVVNLQNERSIRFLMVELQLMSRKEESLALIEQYQPRIRHELNMLFSKLDREAIASQESREMLRIQALDLVNGILVEETGKAGIDDVYFTKFVMQ